MAWTTPATWVSGAVLTSAQLNEQVRDNMSVLSTALLLPTFQSGQAYGSQGRATYGTAQTMVADRLYAIPFHVPATKTFNQFQINTTAEGNVRFGIYNDSSGLPGALVVESASTATSTPTTTAAISQSLTGPALYWLAAVFSLTPDVTAISTNSFLPSSSPGVYKAHAYAALPNPYGASPTWAAGASTPVPTITLAVA